MWVLGAWRAHGAAGDCHQAGVCRRNRDPRGGEGGSEQPRRGGARSGRVGRLTAVVGLVAVGPALPRVVPAGGRPGLGAGPAGAGP